MMTRTRGSSGRPGCFRLPRRWCPAALRVHQMIGTSTSTKHPATSAQHRQRPAPSNARPHLLVPVRAGDAHAAARQGGGGRGRGDSGQGHARAHHAPRARRALHAAARRAAGRLALANIAFASPPPSPRHSPGPPFPRVLVRACLRCVRQVSAGASRAMRAQCTRFTPPRSAFACRSGRSTTQRTSMQ